MGGKVLDYEAKQIRNEGRAEGRAEGEVKGEKKLIRLMACIKADYGEKSGDIMDSILTDEQLRHSLYKTYGME